MIEYLLISFPLLCALVGSALKNEFKETTKANQAASSSLAVKVYSTKQCRTNSSNAMRNVAHPKSSGTSHNKCNAELFSIVG